MNITTQDCKQITACLNDSLDKYKYFNEAIVPSAKE